MRIGNAVKLSTDQINGNKLFLYTQKSGVPVYTVLPDFVIRSLDANPASDGDSSVLARDREAGRCC
jgi:hypothetical protein